jgi:hypothetical protein
MTIDINVAMRRVHPEMLPRKAAAADNTESAGDEEVISAGCWCPVIFDSVAIFLEE